jgi:hypothetical protein
VDNSVGLPKSFTTERTENTEKTSVHSVFSVVNKYLAQPFSHFPAEWISAISIKEHANEQRR